MHCQPTCWLPTWFPPWQCCSVQYTAVKKDHAFHAAGHVVDRMVPGTTALTEGLTRNTSRRVYNNASGVATVLLLWCDKKDMNLI
jgi:hypothetical protein